MNAASDEERDRQHAEHLELLDDGQVADQQRASTACDAALLAVRSCSITDIVVSGS